MGKERNMELYVWCLKVAVIIMEKCALMREVETLMGDGRRRPKRGVAKLTSAMEFENEREVNQKAKGLDKRDRLERGIFLDSLAYQRETVVSVVYTHTKVYSLIAEREQVCLPSRQQKNIKRGVSACVWVAD